MGIFSAFRDTCDT